MKFLFGKKKTDALEPVRALLAAGDVQAARDALRAEHDSLEHAALLRELLIGEREHADAAAIARELAEQDHAEGLVSRAFLTHLEGDFNAAIAHCKAALEQQSDLATAHNHLGRALHNIGETDAARGAFERAVELQHDYAEAWHNLGHVLRVQGQLDAAIDAFERALALSPGYRLARMNLGITLFNLERGDAALACFEELLARKADDADALVNAGLCLQLLGRMDEAREHYEQAIRIAPEMPTAHYYLGVLLNERMQTRDAIAALERALQLDPQDIEAWIELAGVYEQSNQLERAEDAARHAQSLAPEHPGVLLEVAKLARRRGDAADAVRQLRRLDAQHLPQRLAQQYFFELGYALDRNGEFNAAFDAFSQGKALAARNPRRQRIDATAFPEECERLQRWLEWGAAGGEPLAQERDGDQGADLCFLVGFPRSGTTLLDTMLDVSPDVVSIEERRTLEAVIAQLDLSTMGYPGALANLEPNDVHELRALYRGTIAPLVAREKSQGKTGRLIVDKLPLRSLHAALVHRLFPAAKLLFALRHPCDVVLSNFMQQYAPNEAFVHFDTLEACCESYDRVMRVWETTTERLPLNVAYLRYENLVAQPERTLDEACGFLGVERQEAMLDAEARLGTRGRVRTNSYQQVAESLYQRAAGRWRHYRNYLEPHLPLLLPHVERFGYSMENEE